MRPGATHQAPLAPKPAPAGGAPLSLQGAGGRGSGPGTEKQQHGRGGPELPTQQAAGPAGFMERAKRNYRGKRGGVQAKARSQHASHGLAGGLHAAVPAGSPRDPGSVAALAIERLTLSVERVATQAIASIKDIHTMAVQRRAAERKHPGTQPRRPRPQPQPTGVGAGVAAAQAGAQPAAQHAACHALSPRAQPSAPLSADAAAPAQGRPPAVADTVLAPVPGAPLPANELTTPKAAPLPDGGSEAADMALSPADQAEHQALMAELQQAGGDLRGLTPEARKRLRGFNGRVVEVTRNAAFGTPTKSAAAALGQGGPGSSGVDRPGNEQAPVGRLSWRAMALVAACRAPADT